MKPSCLAECGDTAGFRTCIVSGERKHKFKMLRFVVGPDHLAVPDIDEKLPGRGLWMGADRQLLDTACKHNLFGKRARREVKTKNDLVVLVEALLSKKCIELLQLARCSGALLAGVSEVREYLFRGNRGLLVLASDGPPLGARKITSLAQGIPVRTALTSDELGLVLGRQRLVSALIKTGRLAERLDRELVRLAGFRGELVAV